MVYEIGNGAIAPVIALTAIDLGASAATAGFLLALSGIGRILGNVPAALLAERVGDRKAMIIAACLDIGALVACFFASSAIVLGAALLVIGMSTSTFYLARQSYLASVVPPAFTGRAMSALGGSHRVGLFIGPFLGAAVIYAAGLRSAYILAVFTAVCVVILLIVIPDVPGVHAVKDPGHSSGDRRRILTENRKLFLTLGLAIFAAGAVRGAKQTLLPLWAQHLGLGPEQTSLIFGIAGAVDALMFYPSGRIMDRFGRLIMAAPSMLLIAGAVLALPFTTGLVSLSIVAIIMSLGNGLGTGVMLTLGIDAAPAVGRIHFLGIWRVIGDSGNAAGPVVMSIVAVATSLSGGLFAIGILGVFAAAALAKWVPVYAKSAPQSKSLRQKLVREPDPTKRA
ncbi:MFS transporter [Arthrobacter bambusae]|uniref:MFS transporter n=1 Tax=Arthrobacter bambusae TaxID=1338426 RepID=UPI001F5049F4|nr:MFS transporter [Arthrobacter bambusae]MCI0144083.1 MFS transporter [Arthrobacter bambusae]